MALKITSITALAALALLTACSSTDKPNIIHVNEATALTDEKNVFYSNSRLSDVEVNHFLNTKITLPKNLKIAVIHLQPRDKNSYKLHQIEKNIKSFLLNDTSTYLTDLFNNSDQLFENRKVTAELVPDSLVPTVADVKKIRNLGAVLKAQLILVYDSRLDKFKDLQIIKDNQAYSVASADVYLIDTKSGSIVFSKTYTQEAFAEKIKTDLNTYQTLDRARFAGEKKISLKLFTDTQKTLNDIAQF